MPEGFDDRNAPHVFRRLIAHAGKRVLIIAHILFHIRPRHAPHRHKAENHGQQAHKAETPVKDKQQRKDSQRRGDGRRQIRQTVREIRFRSRAGLCHDTPRFSRADSLYHARRKKRDFLQQVNANISRRPERRDMGTHQRGEVNQHGQQGRAYRHPTVSDNSRRLREVRRDRQNFPYDTVEKYERRQSQ